MIGRTETTRASPAPPSSRHPAGVLASEAAGVVLLLAGLARLRSGEFTFTSGGVLRGVGSQLGTTLPAAIGITAAAAVSVGTGAVLVRLARGIPFASWLEALLFGASGAVLLDVALVCGLGAAGLFRRPAVALAHALVLFAGWTRARPIVNAAHRERPAFGLWALVALVWAAPFVLQLASPVAPFVDVLPNHVAPVEHLRTFGSYTPLTTMPSPIYGPSRLFLGYLGLVGTAATLSGVGGGLAVAAFALPAALLLGGAAYKLVAETIGADAAPWALVTVPLTFTFLRLADTRATVLAFPFVAASFLPSANSALGTAVPLGAAILVHPLVGALAALAHVVRWTLRASAGAPDDAKLAGLAAAGVVAVPQTLTMLGVVVPPPALLIAAPAAVGAAIFAGRIRLPWTWIARVILGAGACALVWYAIDVRPAVLHAVRDVATAFPLLFVAGAWGLAVAWRTEARPVVLTALGAWLVGAAALAVLPDDSVAWQSARFEVPKTLSYWAPWFLALAAAAGLAAAWRARGVWTTLPMLFVALAVLPLGHADVGIDSIREHRLSESAAISLHHAEHGYWQRYPDARRVVDRPRAALIAAVRREIDAGRISPQTRILHVASSFQQWAATPLGVFAGVIETDATLDPEYSGHTLGGRLRGTDELRELLRSGYPYVVYEPDGLEPFLRDELTAAGYRTVFANVRGELLTR